MHLHFYMVYLTSMLLYKNVSVGVKWIEWRVRSLALAAAAHASKKIRELWEKWILESQHSHLTNQ